MKPLDYIFFFVYVNKFSVFNRVITLFDFRKRYTIKKRKGIKRIDYISVY